MGRGLNTVWPSELVSLTDLSNLQAPYSLPTGEPPAITAPPLGRVSAWGELTLTVGGGHIKRLRKGGAAEANPPGINTGEIASVRARVHRVGASDEIVKERQDGALLHARRIKD